MLRKMRPEKRVRVEGNGVEGRIGVMWRDPNYVVEMRLPMKVGGLKLHFGSYGSVNEANVARDYAAYVRNSTGKEDPATVGGFRNPHDHPSIYEFEESPLVFESWEASCSGSGSRAQARCDEYKSVLELQTQEACNKFCMVARKDIPVLIKLFRSRDPQRFPPLSSAEPVDGEIHRTPPPSSSEVGVSPTPGREVGVSMGEGSTSFIGASSLEVQITAIGSLFQTGLLMNVPGLIAEETFMIAKAGIDRIQRELIDKWLVELEPCPIEPETIPVLE